MEERTRFALLDVPEENEDLAKEIEEIDNLLEQIQMEGEMEL